MKKGLAVTGMAELAIVLVVTVIIIATLPKLIYTTGKQGVDAPLEEVNKAVNDLDLPQDIPQLPQSGQETPPTNSVTGTFTPPPMGRTDWNQIPIKHYNPNDPNAVATQDKIVDIAKQMGFPPLLALSLAFVESRFHHTTTPNCDVNAPGCVIDSSSGSKGIMQVTHATAYGRGAPKDKYRGEGSACQANYWQENKGSCPGIDFCTLNGNIQCGIKILEDYLQVSEATYTRGVQRTCTGYPDRINKYMPYAQDPYLRGLRLYNGLCYFDKDQGKLGDDSVYVDSVLEAANCLMTGQCLKKFQPVG